MAFNIWIIFWQHTFNLYGRTATNYECDDDDDDDDKEQFS